MVGPWSNHILQSTLLAAVAALVIFTFRKNRAQMHYWLSVALALSISSPIAAGSMREGQSPAQNGDGANQPQAIHFVVASIRQESDDCHKDTFQTTEDGILITHKSLKFLIGEAFGVPQDRVLGLPGWTNAVCYRIEAKVDDSDLPQWKKISDSEQYRPAFRELITKRFALKAHPETKQRRVLSLIIAKNGPKFHEARPGDAYLDGYKNKKGIPSGPGVWVNSGQVTIQGGGIAQLVDLLNDDWLGHIGYPIEDRTGLTGIYDIKMQWQPAEKGSDDPNSPLFAALQEQLGLKLKSNKGPVKTIVVDHVEPPSPN